MSQITVNHETNPKGGRYVVTLPGIAESAYLSWINDGDLIVAEHSFAPDAMRGKGVAIAMVQRLIEDARKENRKIRPDCPYVRAQFDCHTEWADLRAASA